MKTISRIRLFVIGLLLLSLIAAGTALAQDAGTPPAPSADQGSLKLTCDIQNITPTDILACHVTLDGVVQGDLAPAQ